MEKRQSVKVIVRVVIIIALAIQFARFDNIIVSNYHNESNPLKEEELFCTKLTERFSEDDSFLLLYDSDMETSFKVFQNVERVMKQLKKKYRVMDLSNGEELLFQEKTVLVMIEHLERIPNWDELITFMENGGNVAILVTPDQNNAFDSVKQYFGIIDAGQNKTTEGITFGEKFVPGYHEDTILLDAVKNFSIPVTLQEDCDVYMQSQDEIPLLWTKDANKGRFLFFNGTMYQDKIMTGFITRSLALLNQEFLYPIINSKVIWLDDFPAPMVNTYYPEIRDLYNKTVREFYIDIWWPEMLELSKKYHYKYTGVMIQTYNNLTKPPFLPAVGEIEDAEFVALGRELIASGGELGLHGYNHQSLTSEAWKSQELEYNAWNSPEDMEKALEAVKKKLKKSFPQYELNVYVPPSNVIDRTGILALKKVFPEIDVIGSVYYEDYQGLSYTQEFDYSQDKVLNLPRFSSGYHFGMSNRLSVLNGILGFGAVQHFIHPDDFMDMERSEGKSWPEQLKTFEEFVGFVDRQYPFIQGQTASEGSKAAARYIGLDYSLHYGEDGIQGKANGKKFPIYMFLRTPKEISGGQNCQIEKFGEQDYFVTVTGNEFLIKYRR